MSPSHGEITHVSDTALMVAACRALETQSPEGLVQDPFAASLAGDRGMAILNAMPRSEMLRFGIGVRSRFIDELLSQALASHPVATVLSLGCGLDTRPWRLELPSALRWIEVDFADMLDYKDAVMSGTQPRCRREGIPADLTKPEERRAVFTAVGPELALVITEGLLMYLPAAVVEALAAEAGEQSGIAHWISDISTTAFANAIGENTVQSIRRVQASDSLAGEQILEALHRHGWVTAARKSYITGMAFAAERIRRLFGEQSRSAGAASSAPPPASAAPPPAAPPPAAPPTASGPPEPPPSDDPTGVHLLGRLGAANHPR